MKANPLLGIKALNQSIWLDYIQRDILKNGEVAKMIKEDGLTGMTSNPAIFEKTISEHDDYDDAIKQLAQRDMSAKAQYEKLVIEDIQLAADIFRGIYDKSNGRDGFVSLEVSPHLAYNTQQTTTEAKRLWAALDRPNVMIKVPATRESLPAITQLIAAGININVTLLFSVERYQEVLDAFMAGLEIRVTHSQPLEYIASVASFFLSRIDTLVDKHLDEYVQSHTNESSADLRGQTAVACARLAYQHYLTIMESARWQSLASRGAQNQRLLWASTGTKDPIYSDIKYVEALIGRHTVNTMPPQTLAAYRDHGRPALRIEQQLDEAYALPEKLDQLGIDLGLISEQLESEGVEKFIVPFDKLLARLSD